MPKHHVLIATPAHGHALTTLYHDSILALVRHFSPKQATFDSKIISIALLSVARNFLASYFLEHEEYTHLLFVDADMGFAPQLIEKMLAKDVPVVGSIYPSRAVVLERKPAKGNKYEFSQQFVGDASLFVGPRSKDGRSVQAQIVGGFVRARHCGTGLMLIQRQVLEKMREHYPDLWVADCGKLYRGLGLKQGVLQCFEPLRDDQGIYIGEDVAFCRRWVEGCGGELWVNVSDNVTHLGHFANHGNYLEHMQREAGPG